MAESIIRTANYGLNNEVCMEHSPIFLMVIWCLVSRSLTLLRYTNDHYGYIILLKEGSVVGDPTSEYYIICLNNGSFRMNSKMVSEMNS